MTKTVLRKKVTKLRADSGIEANDRKKIADELAYTLADTYRLFTNTQGLHWNVQGPLFYSVHSMTEEQYEDMFEAIDAIAERIRALGSPAPQTAAKLLELSRVEDIDTEADLESQISGLIAANESMARDMRKIVSKAEAINDVKTADLLTERIGTHEENAWMLRATIS